MRGTVRAQMRGIITLALVGMIAGMCTGCDDIDDRPASFAYIHGAIIEPNCTTSNCHSALTAQAGIALHTIDAAYLFLTGKGCDSGGLPGEPPGNFVRPGQPEVSRLIYLLRAQEVETPMPPDIPLPDVEIELIERWILEGAKCD